MSSRRHIGLSSVFLIAALWPSGLLAQRTGLDDLVGARAGQAEGELARRGYRNTGVEKGDDRSYTYWWSADRRQCVTIATMNGRYDSITPTMPADCRERPDHAGWRAPRYDDRSRRGTGVATADLSRQCKGEAGATYDRRPSEITTNAPIRQPNGFIVQGWFNGGRGTTFFNCRFDQDGRLLGVS